MDGSMKIPSGGEGTLSADLMKEITCTTGEKVPDGLHDYSFVVFRRLKLMKALKKFLDLKLVANQYFEGISGLGEHFPQFAQKIPFRMGIGKLGLGEGAYGCRIHGRRPETEFFTFSDHNQFIVKKRRNW
jgi:hypothetical protein